ncbi:MAG: universal stress protein [Frankiaceae bacterium]
MTAARPRVFAAQARAADGTERRPAPVVVGVDGSLGSIAALSWAARQAHATGARLLVVHAWQVAHAGPHLSPVVRGRRSSPMPSRERVARDAHANVESALRLSGCHPQDAAVDVAVLEGEPGPTLVVAAQEASVLVVGTRGHGPLARMLLGSVSAYCTEHATCTVVVVPTPGAAAAERMYPVAAAHPQLERASIPRQTRASGDDAASGRVPATGAAGVRQGGCQGMGNRR